MVFFLFFLFLGVFCQEYVNTPHGSRLKECVYQFPQGTTIGENPDGTVSIEYNNGTTEIITPPHQCHKDMARLMNEWKNNNRAEPNQWLDNAGWYPPSRDISKFTGTYTVPEGDPATGGAVLYYFIGLCNEGDGKVNIIQPVLSYQGKGWTYASWICCPSNITTTGNTVRTKAGATIKGYMERIDKYTWDVYGTNENGEKTDLKQKVGGYKYTWADVTMEQYSYSKCSQSPKGPIRFFDMKIYNGEKKLITPEWKGTGKTMCDGTLIIKSPSEVTIEHSTT